MSADEKKILQEYLYCTKYQLTSKKREHSDLGQGSADQ